MLESLRLNRQSSNDCARNQTGMRAQEQFRVLRTRGCRFGVCMICVSHGPGGGRVQGGGRQGNRCIDPLSPRAAQCADLFHVCRFSEPTDGTPFANKFGRLVGKLRFKLFDLDTQAAIAWGRDKNPNGTGTSVDSLAWTAQSDYVLYPWLQFALRYDELRIEAQKTSRSSRPMSACSRERTFGSDSKPLLISAGPQTVQKSNWICPTRSSHHWIRTIGKVACIAQGSNSVLGERNWNDQNFGPIVDHYSQKYRCDARFYDLR